MSFHVIGGIGISVKIKHLAVRDLHTNFRVATLQSWSNFLTSPDISSEYLQSINHCNSSYTKSNACYFSLQYSYMLSWLTRLLSDAQLYLVENSFLAYFVSITIHAVTDHMQQHIFSDFSFFPRTFPQPDFQVFQVSGQWPLWYLQLHSNCTAVGSAQRQVRTDLLQWDYGTLKVVNVWRRRSQCKDGFRLTKVQDLRL